MSLKQDLLRKLPKLPPSVNRRLTHSTIAGVKHKVGGGFAMTGDPRQLVDLGMHTHWFWGRQFHHVPDKDVNLLQKNVARRKLMSFDKKNKDFRKLVNTDLSGGEDYPLLTTALGLGVGFASAGAGLLWTGFTTAISLAKDSQPIRARDGDEVHQLEIVGVSNGQIGYVEWILLVDPFRTQAGRDVKQWVIHEARGEVRVE